MKDTSRPGFWDWSFFWLLVLFFIGVGFYTEFRGVCQERPKGDLMVYLRAAWAVRSGGDMYTATDHNGWHYHYPPLLAILMVPLASPPEPVDAPWTVPYAATIAIWYVLSVGFLIAGVHIVASALESRMKEPPPTGSRRWWALRCISIAACLPAIAHALIRGQVALLLLLLLCGAAAATLRRRPWQAGFWLAGAICLKVIPAFLLLYPLWRRDLRCLGGTAIGLVVGLALIPAAVFGPARTVGTYEEWVQVLILPALGEGTDHARDRELLDVTATKSQSFLPVIHATLHPNEETRPSLAAPAVHLAHWLLSALITAVTLWAARWRRNDGAVHALLFFGALIVVMLLTSKICHSHYFALLVPLVMGIMVATWPDEAGRVIDGRVWLLLLGNALLNFFPLCDGLELLRDLGMAMYATLILWLMGCVLLRRTTGVAAGATAEEPHAPGLAA